MKIETKGTIRAPIETVFECLTDIEFLKSEIWRTKDGKDYKIQYTPKSPFGLNKKILFILDEPVFSITVIENNGYDTLSLIIELKEYKELLGELEYKATLKPYKGNTQYTFTYTSSEEPVGIFKVIALLLRFFLWYSFWRYKKRFIKFVKSKSV